MNLDGITIDKMVADLNALPEADRKKVVETARAHIKGMPWLPSPGPQTQAYFSPADVLLYGGQAGGGKALALDTPIPTPDGWTTMGRLGVGDVVYDKDGQPCRVVAATPAMIGRPCYRVQFSDGPSIVADAEHQWLTRTVRERDAALRLTPEWRAKRRAARTSRAGQGVRLRPDLTARNQAKQHEYLVPPEGGIRTTAEIAATLHHQSRSDFNHAVPLAEALQSEQRQVAIDPYLLGAWLGDGTSSGARITIAEPEMVEAVRVASAQGGWQVTKGAGVYDYGVVGGMKVALREYGLLRNKHIPAVYLRASFDQRLALLQGLMDTDGYVKPSGNCEFTTTSPALRDGITELLATLGIKAGCSTGRATLCGKDCGEKYRVKFTTHLPVFRLERKAKRASAAKNRATTRHRFINEVVAIPSIPVRCIEVDSPSRTYLCGREMIPTHNSDLGLGLAFTEHRRSLVMRRRYTDLSALTDRAIGINGTRTGFNGSPPPRLTTKDDRIIEFGAAAVPGDEQSWIGRPRDLLYIDETVHFLESQVRLLMGWLRSTDPKQRVRAVFGTNPPIDASGEWIIGMFRPWLDITYDKPAKHGEIRWMITAPDGKDIEVDGPKPVQRDGIEFIPKSRTFIPAKLSDNPYFAGEQGRRYQSELDGLVEPFRSAMRDGNFMAARADADFQVIPTQWVLQAQARWKPEGRGGYAMTACGLDVAAGGDETVLAMRYRGWFAELVTMDGPEAKNEGHAAGMVIRHRKDGAPIVIDVDGGWGGASLLLFKENRIDYLGFRGSAPSSAKTKDGALGFANKRAEAWWKFREELDPGQEGGSVIALPPDPRLRADLTAPTWKPCTKGIQIESKQDIKSRLGRSPDRGDAVVMALSEGHRAVVVAATKRNGPPVVHRGYDKIKRRY